MKSAGNKASVQEGNTTIESDSDDSSDVDYNAFLTTSRRCQEYQQMLQTVQQDLHENLAKVEQRLNREEERGAERPRWTFNDESRYRGVISKLLVSSQHHIQELTRSHTKISNLNDSLAKRLEVIRSGLDQRRADDIQRFTYVTVAFLPLGFATGLFSMSAAPTSRTIVGMVVTAAVALATTVLVLCYAKPLEAAFTGGSECVRQWVAGVRGSKAKQVRGTHDIDIASNTGMTHGR
ncbi:hypothetical protein LRP88_11087 [Fusarium phalaenopsidis]